MPLASSRTASLKRAQALEAEKKERKRMRKSLPSTIPSAFSVDEAKCRRSIARRQSLSSKRDGDNNENAEPNAVRQGPTPYWKVQRNHETTDSLPNSSSNEIRYFSRWCKTEVEQSLHHKLVQPRRASSLLVTTYPAMGLCSPSRRLTKNSTSKGKKRRLTQK